VSDQANTPEHEAFVEGLTTDEVAFLEALREMRVFKGDGRAYKVGFLDGRRGIPDVAELTDDQLTELNRLVNGERGRRYRNRRCQFVGEFVYRNGNSDVAQCTRKPHETGSHTYNGAVIDQ
jgi:hypothetical protein